MPQRRSVPASSLKNIWLGVVTLAAGGCVHYAPKPLAPEAFASALQSRTLDAPDVRAFIAANLPNGSSVNFRGWDLDTLTLAAVYYNPTLAVARAQWRSAIAGKETAGARPNPTVSLSGGYNQDAAAGVTPWIPGIAFDWPIETAGKRDARLERAEATIESARQTLIDSAWTIRRNVRTAWLEVHAAQARAHVLERQTAVQSHIVELLEQRLSAGTISLPEVTTARLARQKSNYDLGDAQRAASSARAHLSEAIGLPLAAVRSLQFAALTETPKLSLSETDARALALHGRADVLVAISDYRGAEADLRQIIAKQYPDVHLGPGLQWDQGERKWTLGIGFEIPVFHRNRGPIIEADAHREELAARVLAAQAKVMAELDAAFESRKQSDAQLERARAVYDAAAEQLRAAEASRNAGDSDALQSESARLESLNAELIQVDTQIAAQSAYAQIEDAVRQPLPYFSRLEVQPRQGASTP